MNSKIIAGGALAVFALALAAKEPVIMNVNGVDVPKSEFEYLYNKNSQQQLNPQPIDEYVDMFTLYKLKVADARAEGIDTLESFRNEMKKYKHELAAPYLADSVYMKSLLHAAHERAGEEVEAYHIMFFKSRDDNKNRESRLRADSVVKALRNGADFAELAGKLSQDNGSNKKGGRMGYIASEQYPYTFEEAAYSLPEGEYSDVVETPMGYHVLKGGKHRPARGKVQVAHILKITPNGDATADAAAAVRMDSIYNAVKANPEIFGDLARTISDDKNSARQNGMLPWFGAGEMVAEFDSVAFALKDGEISAPFKSNFGWHIIKRYASKAVPSEDEMKAGFFAKIASAQDPRHKMVRANQTQKLERRHKGRLNDATLSALRGALVSGLDSAFYAEWKTPAKGDMTFCVIDGRTYPVSGLIERLRGALTPSADGARELVDNNIDIYYNLLLVDAEEDALLASTPDYRNLYREYVDGSLLYEVSKDKVWDKAANDAAGIEKYFENHRNEYTWNEPRAKGYLVQAANDSVAALIRQRASEIGRDSLVNTIRKEFPRQVSIVKVLEPKGANAMVDNIVFGGPETTPQSANLKVYFMIDPRVILSPEDVWDVRGLVTSDYQNEMQKAWEAELRQKYPVKVYDKVLKKVKDK